MRVAVVVGAVAPDAPPDERDTLVQAAFVERLLGELGHEAACFELGSASAAGLGGLRSWDPEVAVNLVEALDGSSARAPLAAAMIEATGVPVTGAGAAALALTGDKLATKAVLAAAGLPTPPWQAAAGAGDPDFPGPYIVKPVSEDASVGIGPGSVAADRAALPEVVRRVREEAGGEVFVERFVDGRELNVSLLAGRSGPRVLPVAEIAFEGWDPALPRVVGYRAKWDPASEEYRRTVRRFVGPDDLLLAGEAAELAVACWKLLGLDGYARVDLRADGLGRLWILEVNANPCLAPDAGFMAAAARGGLTPHEVVAALLGAALAKGGGRGRRPSRSGSHEEPAR